MSTFLFGCNTSMNQTRIYYQRKKATALQESSAFLYKNDTLKNVLAFLCYEKCQAVSCSLYIEALNWINVVCNVFTMYVLKNLDGKYNIKIIQFQIGKDIWKKL